VERSLCGCSFLGMFFDRGIMGLRPTQGDEKKLLTSNESPWKRRPPPCHPDRSEAQWRDLRFSGSPLEMFFDRAERSGEICGAPCGLIHSVWLLFSIIFLGGKTADLSTALPRISYGDPWL
jgi:hypothetical protein